MPVTILIYYSVRVDSVHDGTVREWHSAQQHTTNMSVAELKLTHEMYPVT